MFYKHNLFASSLFQGRRCIKKVTVAGTVTLHHRYIYRGYLQIACVDLTRAAHPALWFVLWDPTQETATRPLALQKDGSWFTYGHDLTKSVWEVFGPSGYIRTSYDYAPFGAVAATGDVSQPFQWSSEFYDSELGLVYYNYRHYSPTDGRWLSRDPIEEQGGRNLYAFVGNRMISKIDFLGFAMRPCGEYPSVRNCKNGVCEGRTSKQRETTTPPENGCGPLIVVGGFDFGDWLVPDFAIGDWALFRPACSEHDRCYAPCGESKRDCDTEFLRNMLSACESAFHPSNPLHHLCIFQAKKYYGAVDSMGERFYESAQDDFCLWESCCEEA